MATLKKSMKYDLATEVLASAVKILRAAGFEEDEIPQLFEQVVKKRRRAPIWIEPVGRAGARSIS